MKREIPSINIEGIKGYAKLLGHNFDSVQECFNLRMPENIVHFLEKAQKQADDKYDGEQEETIIFGGEEFQIWAGGATGGVKWVIKNDDLQMFFKAPVSKSGKVKTWTVSIRYLSGGLWEYGLDALRDRAIHILVNLAGFTVLDHNGKEYNNICNFAEWQRVSRIDYAFDFYSPEFSKLMRNQRVAENLVLPSGVKYGVIGTSTGVETLTAGMNRKGLCIQVYDKGKEITEASGKTWMFKVWEKNGFETPEEDEDGNIKVKNVWRLEVRFGKLFLKDRKTLCVDDFKEKMQKFICEALFKRRLTTPDHRQKKELWDLQPLWAECYRSTDMVGEYAPIGRQHTLRREELLKVMEKQIIGIGRSINVLEFNVYKDDWAKETMLKAHEKIKLDKEHKNKEAKAQERYKDIDEAV